MDLFLFPKTIFSKVIAYKSKCNKVFKTRQSKVCGRKPLKIQISMVRLKHTMSLYFFKGCFPLSAHKFSTIYFLLQTEKTHLLLLNRFHDTGLFSINLWFSGIFRRYGKEHIRSSGFFMKDFFAKNCEPVRVSLFALTFIFSGDNCTYQL